ncbi:MAG TPA: YdcF family protein [Terriglobia bacterium]|nr:YdcF family protein [Terriglobia bacterium]
MQGAWERIIRGIGIVTVAGFLIASLTPASNAVARRLAPKAEEIQPADAIVVLGAGVLHGGMLTEQSMRRAVKGIELFKRGFAPTIVFSGPGRVDASIPTEADIRAKLAETMGIPPGSILKESTANTTHEESLHIAATLRGRNASRILLVTESLHLRRSLLVFEHTGLHVQPVASDNYIAASVSAEDRLWLTVRIIQETVGITYYRLAGYI